MRRLSVVAALFAIVASPHSLRGQVELVVDAGLAVLAGGDFGGTPPGPALGATLYLGQWGPGLGGLEIGYSRSGARGFESPTTRIDVIGLMRYPIAAAPLETHIAIKLGVSHRVLTVVDEPATSDGFLIGPSVTGRLSALGLRVQFGLDALYVTYEELTMFGGREYGTDKDGLRLTLRMGLAFELLAPSVGPRRRGR